MSNKKLSTRVGVNWLLKSKNLGIYFNQIKGFVKVINIDYKIH